MRPNTLSLYRIRTAVVSILRRESDALPTGFEHPEAVMGPCPRNGGNAGSVRYYTQPSVPAGTSGLIRPAVLRSKSAHRPSLFLRGGARHMTWVTGVLKADPGGIKPSKIAKISGSVGVVAWPPPPLFTDCHPRRSRQCGRKCRVPVRCQFRERRRGACRCGQGKTHCYKRG